MACVAVRGAMPPAPAYRPVAAPQPVYWQPASLPVACPPDVAGYVPVIGEVPYTSPDTLGQRLPTYRGGDVVQVPRVPVPEPSSAAILAGAVAMLAISKRKT